MKNNHIAHAHEEAKIYQRYYRPSFNMVRMLRSVLSVLLTGSSPAATSTYIRRK